MKGNMYEIGLAETWELFEAHLRGSRQALVCVISRTPLDDEACTALNNSVEQFAYGKHACTFITLAADTELDARALYLAIEGLDPLCLIATDASCARALQDAFRCEIRTQASSRAMGRTVVSFVDFPRMLKNAQDKQRAWALLKQLPRFDEVQ